MRVLLGFWNVSILPKISQRWMTTLTVRMTSMVAEAWFRKLIIRTKIKLANKSEMKIFKILLRIKTSKVSEWGILVSSKLSPQSMRYPSLVNRILSNLKKRIQSLHRNRARWLVKEGTMHLLWGIITFHRTLKGKVQFLQIKHWKMTILKFQEFIKRLKKCKNLMRVFLKISVTFFCTTHRCKKSSMIIEKSITNLPSILTLSK